VLNAVGVTDARMVGDVLVIGDSVFLLGTKLGSRDGILLVLALGEFECLDDGSTDEVNDGLSVGSSLGICVGIDDGLRVGKELGCSDGTALAQVSQHIRRTNGLEHLSFESSLAAHSQVLFPIPGISNLSLPAASPLQEVQQLSQQFIATSGYPHLCSTRLGSRIAQIQLWLESIPAMENLSFVTSPLQSVGQAGGFDSVIIGWLKAFWHAQNEKFVSFSSSLQKSLM
jgi:hypothetical protein